MNDVREATLIKTSAELDFIRSLAVAKQRNRDATWDLIGTILAILAGLAVFYVCVVWPVSCAVKGVKSLVAPTMPQYEVQDNIASTATVQNNIASTATVQKNIASTATPEVTRKVLEVCRAISDRVPDVNRDGLINCIDYAITFYEQYGSGARIIWFRWARDYSHMLCAVPNGYGQLIYIEPQRSGYELSYVLIQYHFTEAVFRLDQCKDVTSSYKDLKNDTFDWRWKE